jgi:hypothetical protein
MATHRVALRWWMVPIAVAVVAAHMMIPYLLSHVGMSAAMASGVVAIVVVKHLGFGAILARSLHSRLRRRG